MYNVDKRQVDWREEYEEWNTRCPFCDGDGEVESEDDETEYCEHCSGDGYLEMYWNTVWNTELSGVDLETRKRIMQNCNVHVIENYEDEKFYLTLSGCGMDLSPDLAWAWLQLGFKWLPLEWVQGFNKGYKAYLSQEKWDEVLAVAISTLENAKSDSKRLIEKLT